MQGHAQNHSIQSLHVCSDLGEAGFQTLATFFGHTNTPKELIFPGKYISLECAHNIALLLSRFQMNSL